MRSIAIAITCFLAVSSAFAATIHVPADQLTIQAGINATSNGDTVLVAPGEYAEQFSFNGKLIVVRSAEGVLATTVIGSSTNDAGHPTVLFNNGESSLAVLEGFTFKGGPIAIRCSESGPTITRNVFTDQTYLSWAALVIQGPAQIINNTICYGANGGIACYSSGAVIKNNIVAFNSNYGIANDGGILLNLSYNDVFGQPVNYGNVSEPGLPSITADPLFVNKDERNYKLSQDSPCLDAGDPNAVYNDPDGTRNDMGGVVSVQDYPISAGLNFGEPDVLHQVNHVPVISWGFRDTLQSNQTAYEIQVGTDADWSIAESWSTGAVYSSDTSVVYSGAILSDGSTYFLRIRLFNGVTWGGWRLHTFRMNSRPSLPSPIRPDGAILSVKAVVLVANNATDAEGDLLIYDFEVSSDPAGQTIVGVSYHNPQGTSETSSEPIPALSPDAEYWWRCRSFDEFEHSDWSTPKSFMTRGSAALHVPADQPTIQDGINAASDGDTVLVADGHYFERISFRGKKVIVASQFLIDGDTLHIRNTVIDGDTIQTPLWMTSDTGSVVRFVTGEDSTSQLCGFTIQNGTGTGGHGGGVLSDVGLGKPRIHHCKIEHNSARGGKGGGVYGYYLYLTSCSISDNSDGGVFARYPVLDSCVINRNGNWGIICNSESILMNACRVEDNSGDGVRVLSRTEGGTKGLIKACTVSRNSGNGFMFAGNVTTVLRRPVDYFDLLPDWIIDCVVDSNSGRGMSMGDGGFGLFNCTFTGNAQGGMKGPYGAAMKVTRCKFIGNVTGAISCRGMLRISNTLFLRNTSSAGGAVVCGGGAAILRSTFVGNEAALGSAICKLSGYGSSPVSVESCLIAYGKGGPAIGDMGESSTAVLLCTDIFGNASGDWVGNIADQAGINGNFSANPLFCDTAAGDFQVKSSSPCAPANNSCGVQIGAFGIGCDNVAPNITSLDTTSATEDSGFVYHAGAIDPDGPSLTWSFTDRPSWLASDGDSVFGTPHYGNHDTTFTIIASDGFLADTQSVSITVHQITPEVPLVRVDSDTLNLHVVNHLPQINWHYFDPTGTSPQTEFEVAVGTDSNWAYSEMWNPAPFTSPDSFVQYAGAALLDGHTYYLRLRAYNGTHWSPWKQGSFRLNSIPSIPVAKSPINDQNAINTPILWVTNSTDAEQDVLFYDYQGFHDTDCVGGAGISLTHVASGTDSTGGQITTALAENCRYWWQVRAYDGYEYSDWSPLSKFRVNGATEPPSVVTLLSPMDPSSSPAYTMLPTLLWTQATDPDPGDTVRYKVEMSLSSSFALSFAKDSLLTNSFAITDSLQFGTHYWWRVSSKDKTGFTTMCQAPANFWTWQLGDLNGSHMCDLADLSILVCYLTGGGCAISPKLVGDLNGTCFVDLADLSVMVSYLTGGGAQLKPGCERSGKGTVEGGQVGNGKMTFGTARTSPMHLR
jgi:hypothetical protein